jgi:hypothetical protein
MAAETKGPQAGKPGRGEKMVSSPPKLLSQVDLRRAAQRKHTELDRLDSRHSFSFGRHYDPANTHFGLLLVNNDDVVKPGMASRPTRTVTWRSSPGY